MKQFLFYVFILSLFILFMAWYNSKDIANIEAFENKNCNIILLGDSVLKNNSYVTRGKAVDDLLISKTKCKILSLAKNNSTIVNVYSQITYIPDKLNTQNTYIFLSIGGNDILEKYVDGSKEPADNISYLKTIFAAYKKVIVALRIKMDHSNIVLLDMYYPENLKYKQFHPLIREWNRLVYDYARDTQTRVVHISNILQSNEDFTLEIEPSEQGGEKITDSIIGAIQKKT